MSIRGDLPDGSRHKEPGSEGERQLAFLFNGGHSGVIFYLASQVCEAVLGESSSLGSYRKCYVSLNSWLPVVVRASHQSRGKVTRASALRPSPRPQSDAYKISLGFSHAGEVALHGACVN